MRKMVLVLFAAAMLCMVASAAFATTTSGYATWTDGNSNTGTEKTPHRDWTLTTVKCAVCHAVHKANPAGQVLLNTTIANSCVYCHITGAVANIKIYNGVESNYNGHDYPTAHGGASYTTIGSACTDCHSVHAANTFAGDVAVKILRNNTGLSIEATADADYDVASAIRQEQITLFCTQCHQYYNDAYGAPITVTDGSQIGTFMSHVMTSASAAYGGAGAQTGRIANVQSKYCRDCHDAGLTQQSIGNQLGSLTTDNNFPHYDADAARFLLAATYAGNTTSSVGSALTSASVDGVCLKCHRWNADTEGVGMQF